jgi:TRAP-type C4-dicarboxylate transport system substrate-binding protein
VDATGWTQIGLIDLRWNEFLNYRIEPCFFSTDLGVIVNLETWEGLTPEAQEILQERRHPARDRQRERAAAEAGRGFRRAGRTGMQVVELEGEARANYLAAARTTTWERMRELMEENPAPSPITTG